MAVGLELGSWSLVILLISGLEKGYWLFQKVREIKEELVPLSSGVISDLSDYFFKERRS
jgi:hypothetical protein